MHLMNNRYLNVKTSWAVILTLIMGGASLSAQTQKLSDWWNVQIDKKGVKVQVNPQVVVDGILQHSGSTNSSVVTPPIIPQTKPVATSPSTGIPPTDPPAAIPPAGQTILAPPAGTSISAAPTAATADVALEKDAGKATASSVPGKPVMPKITVTPLTMIQQAYDASKAQGGRDFSISANGQHYVFVKRLNLSSWAVVVDGNTGPAFSQIDDLKIQSHGWNDDFSQIVFFAKDAQPQPLLVVQTRDGQTKTYPAGLNGVYTGANGSKSINWAVNRDLSIASRQAVRYKDDGNTILCQIGDGNPVLGPFLHSGRLGGGDIIFDQTYRHYAMNMFEAKPSAKNPERSVAAEVLIVDGQRLEQPGQTLKMLKLFPDGGRYFQITANKVCKYASDRGVIAEPRNPTATIVMSPDRRRMAWVELPRGTNIESERVVFLDGKKIAAYPAPVKIEAMQFTGDSRSLMFVAVNGYLSQLILDGAELPVENQQIKRLIGGPVKGQYAYASGKEMVINGQRFTSVIGQFEPAWFTPDGNHLLSIGYIPGGSPQKHIFVDATRVELGGGSVRELAALKRISGLPEQVGPRKWSYVLNESPFERVDIELAE